MILLFILTFIVTAKATEDTKYIDSLPDKEKEIFIEKVARRILEEVDSKPSKQKSGGEVPEEELDVHAEFVKKILEEEEANLRKHNRNDNEDLSVKPLEKDRKPIDLTVRSRTRRNNKENFDTYSSLENNGAQSDVKTKFDKNLGSKSDDEDIQIKVKQKPNNEDIQTMSTKNVTVKTETLATEEDKIVEVRTMNLSSVDEIKLDTINTGKTNSSSLNNLDDQPTSKTEDNTSFSQNNSSVDKNDGSQKEKKPIVSDTRNTEKNDDKPIIKAKSVDVPVQILQDSVTNIEITSSNPSNVPIDEVTFIATQKLVDNVENAEKEDTTIKSNLDKLEAKENIKRDVNSVIDNIESHTVINDSKAEELSDKNLRTFSESNINSTDIKNTNNNLFIDLETSPESSVNGGSKTLRVDSSHIKFNKDKNDEIVSTSSEIGSKIANENTKGILKTNLENSKSKDDSVKQNIIHTIHQRYTKDMNPVTEHEFEITTQKISILTPLIPLTSKFDTKDNETRTEEADSKIIQVLRGVIDRNKVHANGRFDGIKSVQKIKEYKVYELPKPSDIDDTINKEQPYYYPIYNYSPNNAYYNGKNNFGPHQDELEQQNNRNREQDNQGKGNFEADYFFDGDNNNNRKIKFGYSDTPVQTKDLNFNLPVVVKYPIQFDMDYDYPDIGRKRKKSIKSKNKEKDEESNLKSSLREIRMQMYANKMFGFIPDKTYSSSSFEISSNSSENTTEKSTLRFNFEAILERERNKRDERKMDHESNFAVDYYFNLIDPYLKSNKINKNKQRNTDTPKVKDVLQKIFNKNNYNIYIIDPANLKPRMDSKYITRQKGKKPNFEKIRQILNIANDVDMIPTLNTLLKMNITRSAVEGRDVNIHADVLADLIQTDNTALVQYDWLGTTVNIQGATLKLIELTQLVLYNKYINPSDLELLKYTIYLYKKASLLNQYHGDLRMKFHMGYLKEKKIRNTKELIQRLKDRLRMNDKSQYNVNRNDVKVFGEFLDKSLNSLYELHTAIKEIASITKYNRQNWFKNLKDLYLKRTRNTNLELLLHLTANRLLDLVETSARNGLEYDYIKYIKDNGKEVERTVNEFVFLLKILKEIESNDE